MAKQKIYRNKLLEPVAFDSIRMTLNSDVLRVREQARADTTNTYEIYIAGETLTKGQAVGLSSTSVVRRAFFSSFGSLGAETIANSNATQNCAVAEIGTDKFVIVYRDVTSNEIQARVATVSGTTPTFGTEAVVATGATAQVLIDVCKLDTDKFVAVYTNAGPGVARRARAATVSGTTITLGTEIDFGDATGGVHLAYKCAQLATDKFIALTVTSVVASRLWANTVSGTTITKGSDSDPGIGSPADDGIYDNVRASVAQVTTDKFIIAYRKTADNDGYVQVGTTSGTTITLGAETAFNAADTNSIDVIAPSATNAVLSYRDEGNLNQGTLVACTISGTTPTFGSESVFETGATKFTSLTTAPNSVVVIAYQDDDDTDKGKIVSAKVVGSTISNIGSSIAITTFNDAITTFIVSARTNTGSGRGDFVVFYRDEGNTNQGTVILMEGTYFPNFIGIAQQNTGTDSKLTVQVRGVERNQSGLTVSTDYYILDGVLSTDSSNGASAFVGVARSATEIFLRT